MNSFIPHSDSLQSLSSRVKDRLSGALGYISSGKTPSGENPGFPEPAEEVKEETVQELPNFTQTASIPIHELGTSLRQIGVQLQIK